MSIPNSVNESYEFKKTIIERYENSRTFEVNIYRTRYKY